MTKNTERDDQLRGCYNMELYGTYKQVDYRSSADQRASKVFEETTYHDGSRYQLRMLWTEVGSSLPNNNVPALVQIKSLE